MEKTVGQIYDEMPKEMKMAVNMVINEILSNGEIKHYGVKGMKWRNTKKQVELMADMASDAASIAVDEVKVKIDTAKYLATEPKGIKGLVDKVKIGAAMLKIEAKKTILKLKAFKLKAFQEVIRSN